MSGAFGILNEYQPCNLKTATTYKAVAVFLYKMPNKLNLRGKRFGRLVVIKEAKNRGRSTMWLTVCDCGTKKEINTSKMVSGWTRSCGCYGRDKARECQYKHGGKGTELYRRWISMRARCRPNHKNADIYFNRGITVCAEWDNFDAFRRDMQSGFSPELEIDRIDNGIGYKKENCRWVKRIENILNRRNTLKN